MKLALKEALKAKGKNEVPIGAVIVLNGKVIAKGHNTREESQEVLSHAELNAIKKANKKLGFWRIEDAEIYVTLEPCPMCAGAIIQSRIKKVYFGAYDIKNGAIASNIHLFDSLFINKVEYEGGIMEDECQEIISDFFKDLRKAK